MQRGTLKLIQKKAAHLFLCGLTPQMVAQELDIPVSRVRNWQFFGPFVEYMQKLENKYCAILDKEVIKLRRHAYHVLQEALSSPDLYHQRWAVNTILSATAARDINVNLHQVLEQRTDLHPEAKQAAKVFLSLSETNTPTALKVGEA